MSQPRLLINTPNELLIEADPGKPGNKEQSKQKSGHVCTYYAENYIRHRYGKNDDEKNENKAERQIEKFHSQVRKDISLSADVLSEAEAIVKEAYNDEKQIFNFVPMYKIIKKLSDSSQIDLKENPHMPAAIAEIKDIMQKILKKEINTLDNALFYLREKHNQRIDFALPPGIYPMDFLLF